MMKTIFITGASSGIGKATAELFSANGWRVIATMRNLEKGKDLTELPNVVIMPLDVADSEQIKATCRKVLETYDVDVLLNNAGYGIMAPLERIPEAEIRRLFDTDVIGTMLVTQQFIPHSNIVAQEPSSPPLRLPEPLLSPVILSMERQNGRKRVW